MVVNTLRTQGAADVFQLFLLIRWVSSRGFYTSGAKQKASLAVLVCMCVQVTTYVAVWPGPVVKVTWLTERRPTVVLRGLECASCSASLSVLGSAGPEWSLLYQSACHVSRCHSGFLLFLCS